MSKQLENIREFQTKIAQKNEGWILNDGVFNKAGIKLRIDLLREELNEMEEALENNDIVGVLDAGVDIQYINLGTLHECGVLDKYEDAWDLVHANNLTKLDENGNVVKNANGKVIKPSNYVPVNLHVLFSEN